MVKGGNMPKWMKEDGTPRINIYHSYLVREGRTMLRFKGAPNESKYPKGDATHYVYFNVPDDETDYCLNVERGCVEAIAKAPKNQWVYVTAYGDAETPGTMVVEDGAGPVLDDEHVPVDGPPPMWPEDVKKAADKIHSISPPTRPNDPVALAARMTTEAVDYLKGHGIPVDGDAAARIYNTHFIQINR